MTTTFQQVIQSVLSAVEPQPQRQDSQAAQLSDLAHFADRLGVPTTPYLERPSGPLQSPRLAALLDTLPPQPSKDSLDRSQVLLLLRSLANHLGFYDAADALRLQQDNRFA